MHVSPIVMHVSHLFVVTSQIFLQAVMSQISTNNVYISFIISNFSMVYFTYIGEMILLIIYKVGFLKVQSILLQCVLAKLLFFLKARINTLSFKIMGYYLVGFSSCHP